jgi:hypothetical protein
MSRFEYDDYDSTITQEMWQHNVDLALRGRKGQKALRELLLALDAVPGHRLIRDYLVNPEQGEACAVGAWLAYKRIASGQTTDWNDTLRALYQQYGETEGWETGDIGRRELRVTGTLAQHIAYRNDDYYRSATTPEQLWQATYDWVRSQIVD